MRYYTEIPTPLGPVTAISEEGALSALWFPTQPGQDLAGAVASAEDPVLSATRQWLQGYFLGNIVPCPVPLAPNGTDFQNWVWNTLSRIPPGTSVTYGELARAYPGGQMSPQAIGQAVGRNPIAILIPCHRVLGKDRKLTGYSGGISIKTYLLDLEGIPYV